MKEGPSEPVRGGFKPPLKLQPGLKVTLTRNRYDLAQRDRLIVSDQKASAGGNWPLERPSH
jgi:hypothetical protein